MTPSTATPARQHSRHSNSGGNAVDAAPAADAERPAIAGDDCEFGRSAFHDPELLADSPALSRSLEPRQDGVGTAVSGLDWPSVIWIGGMHLLALAAPFYFTWSGLAICLALCWITGGLGICLGYHRLLTHGSFTTWPVVRFFCAFLGGISGEGSAIVWVANHRKHHAFSDHDGDPHTPRDGGLWSHILWLFPARSAEEIAAHVKRWAPDLDRDPGMHFLHKTFLLWHFIIGATLLGAGWALYGRDTGISWLVWGLAVRMLYVFHVTWFVNSATLLWGYRNYETDDDSRNLWWVGLLAFGEGWHNNHHAFQRMAKHGHRWWEVDVTYWAILAMEKLGLAWNVVHSPRGTARVR